MTTPAMLERFLQHVDASRETGTTTEPLGHLGFGNASGEKARLDWMMGLGGDVESIHLAETHFQLDLKGRWQSGDSSWSDLTGKRPEESMDLAWVSVMDPSVLAKLHEAFITMVQQGASFWEEITIISAGEPKPAFLELSKSSHCDGFDGRFTLGVAPFDPHSQAVEVLADPGQLLWKRAQKIGKVGLIAGAAAACLAAIAFSLYSSSQTVTEDPRTTLAREQEERADPAREARQAESVLRNYHAGSTIEEQAEWVADGHSKLPQMRAFYADGHQPASPVASIHRWNVVSIDGHRHYVAQGTDNSGERFLTLVNLSDGNPKVNWEASVGYGEMSLDTFTETQPTKPVLLRLFARPDDYYNHAFSDSAQFACFALSNGDETSGSTYAYLERRSKAYEQLMENFPNYRSARHKPVRTLAAANFDTEEQLSLKKVTLRVAFNRPTDGPAQMEIKEVLGQQWVVAMNHQD